MSIIKQHKLKIVLIFLLLVSAGLSLYSVGHYQGDSSSINGNGFGQRQGPGQGQGFKQDGGGFAPNRGSGERGPGNQASANRPTGNSSAQPSQQQPQQDGSANQSVQGEAPAPPTDQGGVGNRFGGAASSTSSYATPLAVYTIVFFGFAAAASYVVFRKKKLFQESHPQVLLWSLLGIGLFLRIAAAPWIAGHPFDINLFKNWAASAANSLSGFYVNGTSDYPPFYVFVLAAVGKIASSSAASPYYTLLIKLPSILADVATAYLLYKAAKKFVSFEISLLIAAFYIFNPAVFINSTFWGQVDSFFTMIVVAAILLLSQSRFGWSTALFTAAVLMKPQGIIYVPVLFFALLRAKQVKSWLLAAASAVMTTLIVILPFSSGQEPLWLVNLYKKTLNEYPFASVNGFNFFALLGANYKQDSSTWFLFSYHTWGMAFIVMITLFSWLMYTRGRSAKFAALAALIQIAGVFTFSSSMHERYLFPAAALALLAYAYMQDKRLLWLSAGFSLTIFLNTYNIFYHSANGGSAYSFTLFITSLLNVLLCGYLAKVTWDLCFRKKQVFTALET